MKTEHTWERHDDCAETYCPICEGGLYVCTVCGLIEGSLTSHCPGVPSHKEHGDAIYRGEEDFIDGKWVSVSSPHSPASFRKGN